MLLFMADNCNSGRFGTFLGNHEKDRRALEVYKHTESIFTAVLENDEFKNPGYCKTCDHGPQALGQIPDVEPSDLYEWSAYFFRWSPYATSLTSQRKDTMLSVNSGSAISESSSVMSIPEESEDKEMKAWLRQKSTRFRNAAAKRQGP